MFKKGSLFGQPIYDVWHSVVAVHSHSNPNSHRVIGWHWVSHTNAYNTHGQHNGLCTHSIQAVCSFQRISLKTPTFLFTFSKKWSNRVLLEGQAAVLHHSLCSRKSFSECQDRLLQPCRPPGVTQGAGRCASAQYRATEAAGWSSRSPRCPQVLHLLQAVTSGSPRGPVEQLALQTRPPKSKRPWCLWTLQASPLSDWVERDLLGWGWDWDGQWKKCLKKSTT